MKKICFLLLVCFGCSDPMQISEKQVLTIDQLKTVLKDDADFNSLVTATVKFSEDRTKTLDNSSEKDIAALKKMISSYPSLEDFAQNIKESEKAFLMKFNPSSNLDQYFARLQDKLDRSYSYDNSDLVACIIEKTDAALAKNQTQTGSRTANADCYSYCDHISLSAYYNFMAAGHAEAFAYIYGVGVHNGCYGACNDVVN